jgi:hypothetical protein
MPALTVTGFPLAYWSPVVAVPEVEEGFQETVAAQHPEVLKVQEPVHASVPPE